MRRVATSSPPATTGSPDLGEFADALRRARVDLETRTEAGAAREPDLELEEEPSGAFEDPEAYPAASVPLAPGLGERARVLVDRFRGRELGMGLAFLATLVLAAPLLWVSAPHGASATSVWLPSEGKEGAAPSFEQIERAVSEILAPGRLARIAERHGLAATPGEAAPGGAGARIRADLRVEPRWGPDPATGGETWWLQIAFRADRPDRARAVERDVADLFVGPGLRFRHAPPAAGPARWPRLGLAFLIALAVAAAVGLRPRRGPAGVLRASGSAG